MWSYIWMGFQSVDWGCAMAMSACRRSRASRATARLDEWIGIFGDGMAQIGGQREEKADCIYGAGRDGYEFAVRARLLPQLKNFVERFRRLRGELSQKVGAIRGDLRCRIHWQGPEAVRVSVGFRGRSDGIAREAWRFHPALRNGFRSTSTSWAAANPTKG